MIGVALRLCQSMGLHYSGTWDEPEISYRQRLWWEVRSSLHVDVTRGVLMQSPDHRHGQVPFGVPVPSRVIVAVLMSALQLSLGRPYMARSSQTVWPIVLDSYGYVREGVKRSFAVSDFTQPSSLPFHWFKYRASSCSVVVAVPALTSITAKACALSWTNA